MSNIMNILKKIRLNDPGNIRIKQSLSTITAAGLAVLIVILQGHPSSIHENIRYILFAMMYSLFLSVFTRGNGVAEQKITLLICSLTGMLVTSIITLISTHEFVFDFIMVFLCFWALYLRKYGNKGLCTGIFIFFPFLFVRMMQIQKPALLYILVIQMICFCCVYLIKFYIFPVRKKEILRDCIAFFFIEVSSGIKSILFKIADGSLHRADHFKKVESFRRSLKKHLLFSHQLANGLLRGFSFSTSFQEQVADCQYRIGKAVFTAAASLQDWRTKQNIKDNEPVCRDALDIIRSLIPLFQITQQNYTEHTASKQQLSLLTKNLKKFEKWLTESPEANPVIFPAARFFFAMKRIEFVSLQLLKILTEKNKYEDK